MWRFILLTFALMGWSFYVLSGGADYQPRDGSRQAEAIKARAAAPARLAKAPVANPATNPALVTVASAPQPAVDTPLPDTPRILPVSAAPDPAPVIQPDTVTLSLPSLIPAVNEGGQDGWGLTRSREEARPEATPDIRRITAARVNMRVGPGTNFAILTKLDNGAEVEVLEDDGNGWLRLRAIDSNRVGWIAHSLVSAAAG